jgi:HEAT repeats
MDDHLERLLDGLKSGDGVARKRARETLVLVGDAAIPRLQALLERPDKQLRWEAAKALGTMVDPDSVDTFVRLLDDPNSDLRWLAATGLIELGPRSVRPVLRSLNDPAAPRGHLEMSHRVLGELAKENDVIAGIVGPVVEMLGRNDRGVIAATAARALSDLDRATGRPPEPESTPATDGGTAPPG